MIRTSGCGRPPRARADGADPAVHHVATAPRCRRRPRPATSACLHQHVDRLVVHDVPSSSIGRLGRGWCRGRAPRRRSRRARGTALFERARRSGTQVVGVGRLAAVRGLQLGGVTGNSATAGMPRSTASRHGQQPVERAAARTPGMGLHARAVLAIEHEDRQDQVGGRQPVLGHQPARPGIGAVARGRMRRLSCLAPAGAPGTLFCQGCGRSNRWFGRPRVAG